MKKNAVRVLLIAIFTLVACQTCFADSRYIEVYKDSDVTIYIDKETAKMGNGCVEIWEKRLYSTKGQKGNENKKIKMSQSHVIYFKDRTYAFLGSTRYDADGNSIDTYTVPTPLITKKNIVPDSIGEAIWEFLSPFMNEKY